MSNVKNYAVMICSEVLESVWVLAESEAQAKEFARFVHNNNPDAHLIVRAFIDASVISEQPAVEPNESTDQ